MKQRNPRLLIVEDNLDDEKLIRRALNRINRDFDVDVAHDGEEAVDFLCAESSSAQVPDLVVLDWKLPKVMGADVLRKVPASKRCQGLRVVAFSSSDGPIDREECMRLGGTAYVVKPIDYAAFLSAVQDMIYEHCDDFLPENRTFGMRVSDGVYPSIIQSISGL